MHTAFAHTKRHQSQRQIIDRTAKSLGQGQCHPDGAVSIVALPHIHQPRQPIDGAQVKSLNRYLPQASVRIKVSGGACLTNFRYSSSGQAGAPSQPPTKKDVADSTAADGLYHLICHREHCIVAKTGGQLAAAVDAGKECLAQSLPKPGLFSMTGPKSLSGPMWRRPG